jgi:hypothetical protein
VAHSLDVGPKANGPEHRKRIDALDLVAGPANVLAELFDELQVSRVLGSRIILRVMRPEIAVSDAGGT